MRGNPGEQELWGIAPTSEVPAPGAPSSEATIPIALTRHGVTLRRALFNAVDLHGAFLRVAKLNRAGIIKASS